MVAVAVGDVLSVLCCCSLSFVRLHSMPMSCLVVRVRPCVLWHGQPTVGGVPLTLSPNPTTLKFTKENTTMYRGERKGMPNFAKLQPGRARQKSSAGPGRNIPQPRTNLFYRLCKCFKTILFESTVASYPDKNARTLVPYPGLLQRWTNM